MQFSVLGSGRWGSFIAWYLHSLGYDVCLWGREGSPNVAQLLAGDMNGYPFPKDIRITNDLAQALAFGDAICISISAQGLRDLFSQTAFACAKHKPMLLCMKGLEADTGQRLSSIAAEVVGEENVAVWLGPGHVEHFLAGTPNCMVIDAYSEDLKDKLIGALKGDLIRFYYGTDLLGNEIGAAAKNVIGIAAGMLDGLGLASLKGALMARGAGEVSRLIGSMGGNALSAYGLAHLGDYEATVFSPYSRNRRYGELFVQGEKLAKLAEGVQTSAALKMLGERHRVDLPITNAVYEMLFEKGEPGCVFQKLFMRDLKLEF